MNSINNQPLPGASDALTFGIISLVGTLLCCGPFGAIFGFISLSKAKKAEKLYHEKPGEYTGYDNVKTGRTLSYIGIAIAAVYLFFAMLYFGAIIALIFSIAAL